MALLQKNATLSASTVRTFAFTNAGASRVRIFNNQSGATDCWATLDNSTPTIAGDNMIYVPANSVKTEDLPPDAQGSDANLNVKVISTGTPTIVVELR